MTDKDLLVYGCAVMGVAIGGAYIFLRERFRAEEERRAAVERKTLDQIEAHEEAYANR